MSKTLGVQPTSTPTGERTSLGSGSGTRPSHALPSLTGSSLGSNQDASSSSNTSASLIHANVLHPAAPSPSYVDSQALQVLATEMVHTLIQSSRFVARKQELAMEELQQAGISVPSAPNSLSTSLTTGAGTSANPHNDTMLIARLETIGYHVGSNMVENLARERARFTETLDVLKFICKELWTAVWGKQVDNLRTNHRGVYVLQDNHFRPLAHVSTSKGAQETARQAKLFLAYPVGIVRGALAQLEVPSSVIAETNQAPLCTFHVKTQRNTPAAASAPTS